MTVGELRRKLEPLNENVEVTVFLPFNCKPGVEVDYMHYVEAAGYHGKSSISGPEFQIVVGAGFGY